MEDLQSGAKWYAICAQHLRAAQLGQYGPSLAVDDFRAGLIEEAKGFASNWTDSEFVLVSAQVDDMTLLLNRAVQIYSDWIKAKRPAIQ